MKALALGCLALVAAAGSAADPAGAAVVISSGASSNITCSAGTCLPTAADAVLNVTDLQAMLAAGNVSIATTGAAGAQANDIVVAAYFAWSQPSRLTLDAYRSINVNRRVDVAGLGALTLVHDDGGTGGTIFFGHAGQVRFHALHSQLSVDGAPYVLVRSIVRLAAAIAANPKGNFALASDYNAAADGNYRSSPIATVLTGTMLGMGNTISNLRIRDNLDKDAYVGLFSNVNGTVSGLRLINVDIVVEKDGGNNGVVGAIAGGATALTNDEVTGTVYAPRATAGGLAGAFGGAMEHCLANVTVTGSDAGGLTGYNGGRINTSVSVGEVTASKRTGSDGDAGGIVGVNLGWVDQSYATGRVSGGHMLAGGYVAHIGGVAGYHGGIITNSYATGDLAATAGAYSGGLIGLDVNATTETSYATGRLQSGMSTFFGGFVGTREFNGSRSNNYWDVTTSGTTNGLSASNEPDVTGLTTTQLTAGLPTGFDPAIWGQSSAINHGYPYLLNNPPR